MVYYQVMSGEFLRSKMNEEGLNRFFIAGHTNNPHEVIFMLQVVSAINSGAVHIADHDICSLGDFKWMSIDSIDNDYAYTVDMSIFKDDSEQ